MRAGHFAASAIGVHVVMDYAGTLAGTEEVASGDAAGKYDAETLEALIRLQEDAVEHVAKAPTLTPMQASDLEAPVLLSCRWNELHPYRRSDSGWH